VATKSFTNTRHSSRRQLYQYSAFLKRSKSLRVRHREGQLAVLRPRAPLITNRACISSRPACRHTTSGPAWNASGALLPTPMASLMAHAGYSNPHRLAKAVLPQTLPLNSINQMRPSASLSNSIIKGPRQPTRSIKVRAAAISRLSGDKLRHALAPEPSGFIIRILLWPLHAKTPRGVANPNNPSPTPATYCWASIGSPGRQLRMAESSSASLEQMWNRGLTNRPSRHDIGRAGFTNVGNLSPLAFTPSCPRIVSVSGTRNPASRAI
jgi:hypothetical protein